MLVRLDNEYTVAPSAVEMIAMSPEGWMNVHLKNGAIVWVGADRVQEVRRQLERN